MYILNLIFLTVLLLLIIIVVGTLSIDLFNYINGTGPYVPSSKQFINNLFKIYNFKKSNYVADLGSGDGRILFELARRGIKSKGYEINPFLVIFTNILIRQKHISKKASVSRKNFLKIDFADHNVIIIFGVKNLMPVIETKFINEAKKGTVLICNRVPLPNLIYSKRMDKTYLYQK